MLRITIPKREMWDDAKQEFFYANKEQNLQLEHSLVSLAKWESKWEKPFLTKEDKSIEETLDYVRCMTLTQNVNPQVYQFLTEENLREIYNYINASMTATTVYNMTKSRSNEQVTAELIYYWMIALNIPMECQKWHLNRLLTLIEVCNVKNQPPRKMSPGEIRRQNSALNAARRKKYKTKG